MISLNEVRVIGYVGNNLYVHESNSGRVGYFRMCIKGPLLNQTVWITVRVSSKIINAIGEHIKKGRCLLVLGYLYEHSHKKYKLKGVALHATKIIFMDRTSLEKNTDESSEALEASQEDPFEV